MHTFASSHKFALMTVAAVLLACSSSAFAGGAGWLTSVPEAAALSKKTGRPILAEFTGSDWCGYCIKQNKEVFSTKAFKAWAAQNVILLELDYPRAKPQSDAIKKQNAEMKTKYSVSGYPTIVFMDHEGKVLGKKVGYGGGGPEAFITAAEQYVGKSKPGNSAGDTEAAAAAVKVTTGFEAAQKQAQESSKPLFVALTLATDKHHHNLVETLFAEEGFADLASERMIVTEVKYGEKDASPQADINALKKLLATHKLSPGAPQFIVFDATQEKVLASFGGTAKPGVVVAKLSKTLPEATAPTYTGGWIEDYKQAQAIAAAQNRSIMLDFTGSDWCGWCMKLDKEVFSTQAFKDYADKNLVLVKLDFPKSIAQTDALKAQNKQLAAQFGIQGYPTLIILDAGGKQVGKMGYMEGGPDPFLKKLSSLTSK